MTEKEMFTLPARLTVDLAEEIRQQLIGLLQGQETQVELSGENVNIVDAAGLQLLISFYKAIIKDKKQLKIIDPSFELSSVLAYSGADKVLLSEEGY